MKYRASYNDTEAITVTGQTTYSGWFDVDWANELYAWLEFAESETGSSESIQVTLERETKGNYANQTVLTFTAATGASTEEKHATSIGAGTDKIGTRVRFKYVSSGTFAASQIVTMTMDLVAVRR